MPAVTVDNMLVLPRVTRPRPGAKQRPVLHINTAQHTFEGEGFPVRRAFSGMGMGTTDPFLLLDHMGAIEYAPGEAKGAPWHPHRGFETVTYVMDGELVHHDSNGGGGLITNGDTQWMTAGAGILHDEMPSEQLLRSGGVFHGVQLWVNLPKALKWNPPRYQDIRSGALGLLSSDDGGALLRVIAGELDGHAGPGATHTPITYVHATISPAAELQLPWSPDFNAIVYVLSGQGTVGAEKRPLTEGQAALFGPGEALTISGDKRIEGPASNMDVLILGGLPIREPIAHYGPFVMNTREEIVEALEDFQAGRMGNIPADRLDSHRLGGEL